VTFISYAQNFEDVMLWRALGHVQRGFYVDVGAQRPVIDSVTKAFYSRGWTGINIEPAARWYEELRADRPHDVNLRLVAGASEGSVAFYDVRETGLSTTDAALAAGYERQGWDVSKVEVSCRTLDAILAEHARGDIHFLKIDVEGAEADVLRGLDLRRYRPWILVAESRAPNSAEEVHAAWEPGVLAQGYRFAYDDGLNRFYVAEEHAGLLQHFATPPNVRDDFVLDAEWEAKAEVQRMRSEIARVETSQRIGELSHALTRALADAESLQQVVQRLQGEREDAVRTAADARRDADAEMARVRGDAEADIARVRQDAEAELARARQEATAQAERAAALEATLGRKEEMLGTLRSELHLMTAARQFEHEANISLRAQYAQILASKSWQLTRPLRVLRRLFQQGPGELIAYARRWRSHGAGAAIAEEPAPESPAGPWAPLPERPVASRHEEAALATLDAAWSDKRGQRR
jgi:FkbM family methyltransferase